jgi:hypothetical protein
MVVHPKYGGYVVEDNDKDLAHDIACHLWIIIFRN